MEINFGTEQQGSRKGSYRLAFNFAKWAPSSDEFNKLLSLMPQVEQDRILRYKRPNPKAVSGFSIKEENETARASLAGLLLIRHVAMTEFGISSKDFPASFCRSAEGKPFLKFLGLKEQGSNFNFNVSHYGAFVIIGAELNDLIGVDVMQRTIPRADSLTEKLEFFETMKSCFTLSEWRQINHTQEIGAREEGFFRHWTLKEAYIKAVGIGLGFELLRAQFSCRENPTTEIKSLEGTSIPSATLQVDNEDVEQSLFYLDWLDELHLVATCVLPTACAIKSSQPQLSCISDRLVNPPPRIPWKIVSIEDLME